MKGKDKGWTINNEWTAKQIANWIVEHERKEMSTFDLITSITNLIDERIEGEVDKLFNDPETLRNLTNEVTRVEVTDGEGVMAMDIKDDNEAWVELDNGVLKLFIKSGALQ